MINRQAKKRELHARRRRRVKKKFDRFDGKLRLVITRSLNHITGQIVDDLEGKTVVAASSVETSLAKEAKAAGNKTELATIIGKILGTRAKEQNIESVVFDRNGYVYHGRIKAFADGVRESGLKI